MATGEARSCPGLHRCFILGLIIAVSIYICSEGLFHSVCPVSLKQGEGL